jgi:molecular chaperone GrpE (heat shock protein)
MNSTIKSLIPILDELIALGEFYDSPSYQNAIRAFADVLAKAGVASYDDLNAPYDSTRHDVHSEIESDEPTPIVCRTYTRGYSINGEVAIKSIVDIKI